MLHVEGRDPPRRRTGLADGDADVDEEAEVDLVAAVALRHERTEHARAPERLDHVVSGLPLLLGLGRALGDERHDLADAVEQAGCVVGRAGHVAQPSARSAASATSESSE